MLKTNKLSTSVANELSGYNEYQEGGIREADKIVTGNTKNEI